MRISDWSSDVCSSDLRLKSVPGPHFDDINMFQAHAITPSVRSFSRSVSLSWSNSCKTSRLCCPMEGPAHRTSPGDCGICGRSEEHTSELQSLMRISYAVFCLKKKKKYTEDTITQTQL